MELCIDNAIIYSNAFFLMLHFTNKEPFRQHLALRDFPLPIKKQLETSSHAPQVYDLLIQNTRRTYNNFGNERLNEPSKKLLKFSAFTFLVSPQHLRNNCSAFAYITILMIGDLFCHYKIFCEFFRFFSWIFFFT